MRILVVSQYFWPEVFRVNDIVSGMRERGHEVTVLTGLPNYPAGAVFPEFQASPATFAKFHGAQVLRVPMRPRGKGNLNLVRNYWSFVWQASMRGVWALRGHHFDVIFVFQTSPLSSAVPALLLRRLKRAPLALWVLDLWPDTLSAVGMVRSPRVLRWIGAACAAIYRRCDAILVQSAAFFDPIERWGGRRDRTHYFPAWSEAVFTDGAAVQVHPLVAKHRGRFTVMFAGNLGDAQDLPSVLDAAERLRHRQDIRWLIVGDGRCGDWVREQIAARQLDQVVMLGRHPLEHMPAFFAGADALLVSLKGEPIFAMTIPGKVQSYLAAGKPLIGMLDGEGARVIREAGAGLVAPAGDAAGLARCIEDLAALPEARRAVMAEQGRRYAQDRFDRDALIDGLCDRLESLRPARHTGRDQHPSASA